MGLLGVEVSIHTWLTPLLWTQGKIAHHGRMAQEQKLLRSWCDQEAEIGTRRKGRRVGQGERKELQKEQPFQCTFPVSQLLLPHPTCLQLTPSSLFKLG